MNRQLTLVSIVLGGLWITAQTAYADPPAVEAYLVTGGLADGERELEVRLRAQPADAQLRFGLGFLRFNRAVEQLAQSLYRFGTLGADSRLGAQLPLLRLAVPKNPAPEEVRYEDIRAMIQRLLDELTAVEATLAPIQDQQVKLPLHFGLIRLDLNGDGTASNEETLWRIYAGLNQGLRLSPDIGPEDAQSFLIVFDYGDVHWLRGYCHLLSALCEFALAYDMQASFDVLAQQLFDRATVAPPSAALTSQRIEDHIADAVAAVHVARFSLQNPARMRSVLTHLEQVVHHSRESWKAIQAEGDNECEWIPNSKQEGVIPGVRITPEMIAGWHDFLNEAESLLAGKSLVPHWRLKANYGINLRRVFLEPRDVDVVLWAHGASAIPYVEMGRVTSDDFWWRLQQVFQGQFIGFAFWFN